MNRMLSKAYVDRAHPECRFGCCAVRERHTHGGRRDGRVRRVRRRSRAAGLHRYRDEIEFDGGKVKMRRSVRHIEKDAFRREWGHLVR